MCVIRLPLLDRLAIWESTPSPVFSISLGVSLHPPSCRQPVLTGALLAGNRPSDSIAINAVQNQAALAAAKLQLHSTARFICLALVISNFLMFVVVALLGRGVTVLFALALIIFVWPLFQMFLSLIFLVKRILLIGCHTPFCIAAHWAVSDCKATPCTALWTCSLTPFVRAQH
jgi:hypothetical protein